MKELNEIKPKEIKSSNFEVKINFTNHDKYGLIYNNKFLYIKSEDKEHHIFEIDVKFDKHHLISLDTLEWLYSNNRLLKKDKRKIKLIINQLKTNQ